MCHATERRWCGFAALRATRQHAVCRGLLPYVMRYFTVVKPCAPRNRTPHATLDDKRRLKMATDTARGMNYLHSCRPPIVHRDLKSPNLLVDKDFTIKARRATPLFVMEWGSWDDLCPNTSTSATSWSTGLNRRRAGY